MTKLGLFSTWPQLIKRYLIIPQYLYYVGYWSTYVTMYVQLYIEWGFFYSFEFVLTNTLWFSWEKKSTWIVFIGNSRFLYYLCAIQITVTDLMKYSPEIGHLKKPLQSLFYEYEMCYYIFFFKFQVFETPFSHFR